MLQHYEWWKKSYGINENLIEQYVWYTFLFINIIALFWNKLLSKHDSQARYQTG